VLDKFIDEALNNAHYLWLDYNHTFLFLTKRPDRMQEQVIRWSHRYGNYVPGIDGFYFGFTVCNQQEADAKIPIFLQAPGKKFLSIEPMLGAVDISKYFHKSRCTACGYKSRDSQNEGCLFATQGFCPKCKKYLTFVNHSDIDAVILGGETGPGARPMHPDWVRSIRDQCAAADVPFFFKGWGEWLPASEERQEELMAQLPPPSIQKVRNMTPDGWTDILCGRWSNNLLLIEHAGRKKAGRLLDGRTHDDLPWIQMMEGQNNETNMA
jgi:protein gp37